MFPFCLHAPCLLDGLHKAGNVSDRLWLTALHPPLSLKPSQVGGWRREQAGRKLLLATCLRCRHHAWPEMLGVPGDGDASAVPGNARPRETPRSCILQGREHPKPFQSPKPF